MKQRRPEWLTLRLPLEAACEVERITVEQGLLTVTLLPSPNCED